MQNRIILCAFVVLLMGLESWATPPLAPVDLATNPVPAVVRLPRLFSDNMVIQRDLPVPVWGWAQSGTVVAVHFAGQSKTVTTDSSGKWQVTLAPMSVNAVPQTLTVSGTALNSQVSDLRCTNVLVGDIWLCSGQSNMEWLLGACSGVYADDVAFDGLGLIRQIKVNREVARHALDDFPSPCSWQVGAPETAKSFTAVGFYFARRVVMETKVPIGLVSANWGGSWIEPWTAPEGLAVLTGQEALMRRYTDALAKYHAEVLGPQVDAVAAWLETARANMKAGEFVPPGPKAPSLAYFSIPHAMYNAMIAPVLPARIKGVLWYQGEANGAEGDEYIQKMKALICGWRTVWGKDSVSEPGAAGADFPFYYVQLANFGAETNVPAAGDGYARLRDAQRKALSIPNTGMAVTIDIGEARNIHPKNKFDVGERLARWALRDTYGRTNLVASGPLYDGMMIEGASIRIRFQFAESGLMVGRKDGRLPVTELSAGALCEFAIAGEDRQWQVATAVVDGSTVVVSAPSVKMPKAVRYAFSASPAKANLYNRDGLPASPFRTDDW